MRWCGEQSARGSPLQKEKVTAARLVSGVHMQMGNPKAQACTLGTGSDPGKFRRAGRSEEPDVAPTPCSARVLLEGVGEGWAV